MFDIDKLLKDNKLYWQYPVITEKTFYLQERENSNYVGFPWATVIDKKIDHNKVYNMLKSYIKSNNNYTCCQHICFKKIIPLFKRFNIKTVYTSHKIIGQNSIDDITLKPCPLYAINVEDNDRNSLIKETDLLNKKREYLYSFVGAVDSCYLSNIRNKIFQIKKREDIYIKHIGTWYFNPIVYTNRQNISEKVDMTKKEKNLLNDFNEAILNSRYSLSPSGSGPNSIRFWESLGSGSIPVLLSDTLDLPEHSLWDKAIVRIKENQLNTLDDILKKIDEKEERERRVNCLLLYKYFKDNYINKKKTMKRLFTSYKCEESDPIVTTILNKWKELNPDYIVQYFSDDDVKRFFEKTEWYSTYSLMRNGVAIADFFRMCYIQTNGGYWFDIDLDPFKVDIPDKGDIHLFDAGFGNISYMFIGGNPGQKLFKDVITKVVEKIKANYSEKREHVMDITGPRIIQNLIFNKIGLVNKDGIFIGKLDGYDIILKGKEYEFQYKKIKVDNHKTNLYKQLQKKYGQKAYQKYNYI